MTATTAPLDWVSVPRAKRERSAVRLDHGIAGGQMAYFVVRDGAIEEAFESLDEATAHANARPGARVIGDEWVTLASAKDRVRQALAAIDEIAPLLRAEEVEAMKAQLQPLQEMIDSALGRLGLRG